jgi:pimeloyl-ACP methyl ester carboxylesterase
LLLAACESPERTTTVSAPVEQTVESEPEGLALTPASRIAPERRPAQIRVEPVELSNGRQVSVLRGALGDDRIAFLHGLCSSGAGYLESFQFAAAERGLAVAPNGDVACPGGGRRSWSHKLDAIDRLIVEALRAGGATEPPRGVTLIGYSLGASRAAQIARKHPERYDALILIGAPTSPLPRGLEHLRAAAMMAGERDRQDLMKNAVSAFRAANIASEFFELPQAAHGQMGPDSERVMREVLAWMENPAKAAPNSASR